ncbi:MAG TPA: cystathionine beta-synthase [Balneolales bacterium]|nr:cystathionine beta-synthase [Balneolales bacterium]
MWYQSIIETIGNTPLVELHKIKKGLACTMLGKVEYFNPGQSVKDRIALKMIEDAEREGKLKPGATIVEGTSGNTGTGLALVAAIKGYRCIFTTTDKQSQEKINILRALGAEVKVCPTNVEPDDPRSYYSVAQRLNSEIPNSYYPNQYDNPSNSQAHYETTGPELWEQTDGKITHFIAGIGTGGTLCGTARYLKEKNPDIKIIGIDPVGSVYKSFHDTGKFDKSKVAPYLTEGIGEDIIPENVDMSLIDEIIQCPDKEAFLTTRELATLEGLFVGGSCGSAVWGAREYARANNLDENALVVVLLPDSGTRYVSKVYNDEWMRNNGFFEYETTVSAHDIITTKSKHGPGIVTVRTHQSISEANDLMNKEGISQLPVVDDKGTFVGSLLESHILNTLIRDPAAQSRSIAEVMGDPFPVINHDTTIEEITNLLDKQVSAVIVTGPGGKHDIITRSDLINAIMFKKQKES